MKPSHVSGLERALADTVETPAEFPESAIRFETLGSRCGTACGLRPTCISRQRRRHPASPSAVHMARKIRRHLDGARAARICGDLSGRSRTVTASPTIGTFTSTSRKTVYDFIDWVVAQPWYDGFIGAMGGSYDGGTQFCMATNPKMTAIMPEVAGLGVAPSPGVRFHMYLNAYSKTVGKGKDKVAVSNVDLEAQMKEETLATGYFNEPMGVAIPDIVFKLCHELAGVPEAERQAWLWAHFNALTPTKRVAFLKATLDTDTFNFDSTTKLNPLFGAEVRSRRATPAPRQRSAALPVDACAGDACDRMVRLVSRRHASHLGTTRPARRQQGAVEEPAAGQSRRAQRPGLSRGDRDLPALRRTYRTAENLELLLQWYGAVRNGTADAIPAVTYYLMGANEWRTASAWPLAEARPLTLYLAGDAGLRHAPPDAGARPSTYVYDPDQPTPTMGGSILSNVYRPGSVDVAEVQRRRMY